MAGRVLLCTTLSILLLLVVVVVAALAAVEVVLEGIEQQQDFLQLVEQPIQ